MLSLLVAAILSFSVLLPVVSRADTLSITQKLQGINSYEKLEEFDRFMRTLSKPQLEIIINEAGKLSQEKSLDIYMRSKPHS